MMPMMPVVPAVDPTHCLQTRLALEFGGEKLLPGTSGYEAAITIDNRRAIQRPLLVAEANSASDIGAGIAAANACEVSFSVLGGGHSAAGYGLNHDGLVISLRAMRRVMMLNAGRILVEGGAKFTDIYKAVQDSGWVPIGGGCPQVGVGGFTLGGGWSFLSRSYGLAIDNLVAVNLTLANQTQVAVSASTPHGDLWWGLRGGGGGNFGIATSFEMQMRQPEPLVTVGELCWPPFASEARQAFEYFLSLWPKMPSWLNLDPVWLPIGARDRDHRSRWITPTDGRVNDGSDPRMFCFTIVCNRAAADCDEHTAPLLALVPSINTLERAPFLTWQLANVNVTAAQHDYLYLRSGVFLPGRLTMQTFDLMSEALRIAPSKRNLVLFHVGGGEIAKISAESTAFPHRGCQVVIQVKAIWSDTSEAASNTEWVRRAHASIEANLTGAYVNYIDSEQVQWEHAYYAGNYPRLQRLKELVDPANLFRFNQSIRLP